MLVLDVLGTHEKGKKRINVRRVSLLLLELFSLPQDIFQE